MLTFLKVFAWSLYVVSPLLISQCLVIFLIGQYVARHEKWNKFDGFYWSFITATTVGYGDIRPQEKTSKSLSIVIAILGMIFTGIIIAVALQATSIALDKHLDPMMIEKIKANIDGD